MDPKEKNDRFWNLLKDAQIGEGPSKWRNLNEFSAWVEAWGGRIKKGKRSRKGYVVRQFTADNEEMSYELPEEFVDRCLVLGCIP